MSVLTRIRSVWENFIERLRSKLSNSHSQTVIFDIEVTSESPSDTDIQTTSNGQSVGTLSTVTVVPSDSSYNTTNRKTTTHALRIQLSDKSIVVDGSQTDQPPFVLTEECLTAVLKKHPKLQEVTQLVVTRHSSCLSIPVFIGKLINLTILDLSVNSLQDLPWSIVCLNKLKILNLSGNQFYTVPPIVGQLTSLEQLLLSDNCLEYLPSSLLNLEKLRVLQVSGNPRLVAPSLSVCSQGVDAVFKNLRKRCQRRNLWSDSTSFYRPQSCDGDSRGCVRVKSLLELSVATVLQFNIDFFSLSYIPPPLKRHLYDNSKAKMAAVRVAKCSQCSGFFSSEAYFDGHECRR